MVKPLHFLKKIEEKLLTFLQLEIPIGGDDVLDNLYLDLHKAVLCGEYYYPGAYECATDIENYLRNFIDKYKIKEIPENDSSPEDGSGIETTIEFGTYDFYNDELSRKFEKKIRYLNQFKELANNVNVIQNYFNKGKKVPVVDLNVFKSYAIKLDISEILADEIVNDISEVFYDSLFQINLLLSYIDEYLECDETTIKELQRVKLFLKAEYRNNINGEVYDILVSKVNFLSYKIEYRLNRKSNIAKPSLDKTNHFYFFLRRN